MRRGRNPETGELLDVHGLSVSNTAINAFNITGTVVAAARLLVGDIALIGLGILPNRPTHANINGLPTGEDAEDNPVIEREAIKRGNELKKIVSAVFENV